MNTASQDEAVRMTEAKQLQEKIEAANAKFERQCNKEKRQQIKIACLEVALRNTGCGVPNDIVVEAAKAFYNFVRT